MAEENKTTEEQSTEVKKESAEPTASPKRDVKKTQSNNLVEEGKIRPPVSRMFTLISAFIVGGLVTFGVWLLLTYPPWSTGDDLSTQPIDTKESFVEQHQETIDNTQQVSQDVDTAKISDTYVPGQEVNVGSEPYENYPQQQQEAAPMPENATTAEEKPSGNSFPELTLGGKNSEITPTEVAKKVTNIQEMSVEPVNVKWSEFSKSVLSLEQERASVIAVLAQKVPRMPKRKEAPLPIKKYSLRSETKITSLKPLAPPPAKITWRYVVKQLIELEVQREKTLKQLQKNDI